MSRVSRTLLHRVSKWMSSNGNTQLTTDHLTPSIPLRLITPQCPLWMSTPEQCPFPDPYWAFYWPGGQVLAKYVTDNPSVVANRRVLDFGAGCGASTIACLNSKATLVVVNDIDQVALCASIVNLQLNGIDESDDRLSFVAENLLESTEIANSIDTLLVGDMFYDTEFGDRLHSWLRSLLRVNDRLSIYIGDPDRHALPKSPDLVIVEEYPLPGYITREHYGFSTGRILKMKL